MQKHGGDSSVPHKHHFMDRPLLTTISQLAVLGLAVVFLFTVVFREQVIEIPQSELPASVEAASTSTPPTPSDPTPGGPAEDAHVQQPTPSEAKKPLVKATESPIKNASAPAADGHNVFRILNPYTTPPLDFEVINTATREALVNILCLPHSGALRPISGSGIMIDPRGIILTNAHVAQYVLLSQSSGLSITCTVRTGSPARAISMPKVLYIPSAWVQAHAKDILNPRPVGTGVHDYALLYVGAALGQPLSGVYPSLLPDAREAIGFTGDSVLVASYPAEFLGGLSAQSSLFPVSTITRIGQLLTLETRTVDVVSLGGVIGAQSGSSGGAIVNQWGRLIGVITTTSEGATTAERDLRGITLSYIDRDIRSETGESLDTLLARDPLAESADFAQTDAPQLLELYLPHLK